MLEVVAGEEQILKIGVHFLKKEEDERVLSDLKKNLFKFRGYIVPMY